MSSKLMSNKNQKIISNLSDEEIVPILKKELIKHSQKMVEAKENYKLLAYNKSKESDISNMQMKELKTEYMKLSEEYDKLLHKIKEIEDKNKIQQRVQKLDEVSKITTIDLEEELKEFNEKCKKDAKIEGEKSMIEFRKMFKKF